VFSQAFKPKRWGNFFFFFFFPVLIFAIEEAEYRDIFKGTFGNDLSESITLLLIFRAVTNEAQVEIKPYFLALKRG
jgi:hypothetical protein